MGAHTEFFSSFSRSALTMSSNQEDDDQEAGPSGISREETLALLRLDRSDPEQEEKDLLCHEVMEDSEDDDDDAVCNEVMDRFERQRVVEEDWIHKLPWEPLNLILNPLWIDRVAEWACANVISIPDYVKRGTLSTVLTWSKLSKMD